MESKIREIRTSLYGTKSLIEKLNPEHFVIDIDKIPVAYGFDLEKWLKIFNDTPYAFIDSKGEAVEGTPLVDTIKSNNLLKATDSVFLSIKWLEKVMEEMEFDIVRYITTRDIESSFGVIPSGTISRRVVDGRVTFDSKETSSVTYLINSSDSSLFEEVTDTMDLLVKWMTEEEAVVNGFQWSTSTHIERLEYIIGRVKEVKEQIRPWYFGAYSNMYVNMYMRQAYHSCIESYIWLEAELDKIKDKQDGSIQ
jgi:hypothetical protein